MLFAGLHGFSKIRHISVLILHFAVDALTYQDPDLCLWKKICKIFVHDKFFHLLVLLICDLSCLRSFSAVVLLIFLCSRPFDRSLRSSLAVALCLPS